jgi:ABC-type nitrate/sulfonate/bicarbonate transport system substrate-binding protein
MIRISRRNAAALALSLLFAPFALEQRTNAADLKPVKVALDWTPNTNHVGLYVAKAKGYFKDAGLDVTILPYGDTAAGTLVSNHVVDFGVAGVGFYSQHAAGADLRAVYAVVQAETGRLVVNGDRSDITSPKNLDGLTYGGFGSAWENTLLSSIIKNAGGRGEFKSVTLGTSAYEALANKTVDFTLEIKTWEGVQAELAGVKLKEFKYSDYGVPEQYTTVLVSSDEYLKGNSDAAKAFLSAVTKGYEFAATHPDEASDLLVAANPDVLTDPKLVKASLKLLAEGHYLQAVDGTIGKFDLKKVAAVGDHLVKNGILVDQDGKKLTQTPDFAAYVTNDYLPAK